ncbi:DEKNAAC101633 [Brettanomyces naardenensis]|uniref:DEKNAAC101633 n=1 Tax=Brettanomyces naardenensis TaxID=13370 RepID=A0A448YIC4_BRENA|nr:DEKNAAC101633 [Brettanomyces naardenensis]
MYSIPEYRTPERFKRHARDVVVSRLGNIRNDKRSISSVLSKGWWKGPEISSHGSKTVPLPRNDDDASLISSESSSIFSRTSMSTASSLGSINSNLPPNFTTLTLTSILNQIALNFDNHIGNIIFNELNEKLRSSPTKNQSNSPERLVDWNLNLFRTLLFINVRELPEKYRDSLTVPYIFATINDANAISRLASELVLIANLHDDRYNVLLNRVASYQGLNIEMVPLLKVERYDPDMTDEQFQELLVNSDLFKEFNIDDKFKRNVARISLTNASRLYGKDRTHVLYLTLRNYLLNMLVAAQTLFEFHYGTFMRGGEFRMLGIQNERILWERIRERNYGKIEELTRVGLGETWTKMDDQTSPGS